MSYTSAKLLPQHPAYGLRDRCPALWTEFRKCLYFSPSAGDECKPVFTDFKECVTREAQREYTYKVEKAVQRQREAFREKVEAEEAKLNISYIQHLKDKYL